MLRFARGFTFCCETFLMLSKPNPAKIFRSLFIAVKSFKNISQRVSGWTLKPSVQVLWFSQAKIDGTCVHCFRALSSVSKPI